MTNDETDRRTLLRAGAMVVTVGAAGCSELDSVTGGGNTQNDDETLDLREIRFGETRQGQIDKNDEKDPVYDDLAEPVTFEGEADQQVVITMESDAFDPYVVLTDGDGEMVGEDDDGADEDDSRLRTTLEADGSFTIWAGSFDGDGVGTYTLSLEEGSGGSTDENDLRQIDFGQTLDGVIDQDDPRDPARNELAEPVTFEASAEQAARITMRSDEIDPYLVLGDGDGNVLAENDDGASEFNSRMEPVLPEDGTYTIWAGAFETGATGSYTLSLEEGTAPETTDLREIEFGQTREGYIDTDDGRDPVSDKLGEPVTFEASADQVAAITMESEQLDPYLVLTDDGGNLIAENDDGAGGFNSRIEATLPEDGNYTVWATTFGGEATGRYTLGLEEGTTPETTDLREIGFGETREGYIDSQDGQDPQHGDLAEPVAFEASSDTTVRITMRSDAIDPYLVLATESGTVVTENDDGADGYNSRIETTLQQDTTYVIWAGSYSGSATGAYTLSLEQL